MTIQLRYLDTEGRQVVTILGTKPLVVGRSAEVDVHVADEKASRQHCEVRVWDGDHVLKDLSSRNGTFLNDVRTEIAVLHVGDQIRIGSTVLHVERVPEKGARTILKEVSQERESGKGYKTILREIVQSTAAKPKA